jgi:hypothetical protein
MAFISNSPDLYQSGVDGPMPTEWYGVDAPDGDASDFAQCGPGSRYIQVDIDNEKAIQLFKGKNDARDDDWSGVVIVSQRFSIADFTDGGATVGTLVLDQGVPVGAFAVRCFLQNVTGFTGNVSATMQVGDGVDAVGVHHGNRHRLGRLLWHGNPYSGCWYHCDDYIKQ